MIRLRPLLMVSTVCALAFIERGANGQTIKFIDLRATYTLTESKTLTNPSPERDIVIEHVFTDDRLSLSAESLARAAGNQDYRQPGGNPSFYGALGHDHGENSLLAKAVRELRSGSLANSTEMVAGVPVAFGGVSVDIKAHFKVDAPPDQSFRVFESDALNGRLLTVIDPDVLNSEASASVVFATRLNQRTYRQGTSGGGTSHRISVGRPVRENRTVNTPGDPEFMFTAAAPNDSRIHFATDSQFLELVRGQQPFEVTLLLSTGVVGIRGGTTARSDFFDTASLDLRAEAVPEPSSFLLFCIGSGAMAAIFRQRSLKKRKPSRSD